MKYLVDSKNSSTFVPNFERMIYYPELTIEENAKKNGVTVHAVRQYIKNNKIDRRTDEQLRKRALVIDQNKKGRTFSDIVKATGFAPNTVRKYLNSFNVEEYRQTINPNKISAYNSCDNQHVIRSVSETQNEILRNILNLYIKENTFECDLTYSTGIFYQRLEQPQYKFDKFPLSEDVMPLERAYLLDNNTLKSVVIDLPFIVRPSSYKALMVDKRFTAFQSVDELIQTNREMLRLAYDLLKKGGYAVIKTQDTNCTGRQIWTSFLVQQFATELGFKLEDIFILLANHAIVGKTLIQQRHARKYHSYFLVFRK